MSGPIFNLSGSNDLGLKGKKLVNADWNFNAQTSVGAGDIAISNEILYAALNAQTYTPGPSAVDIVAPHLDSTNWVELSGGAAISAVVADTSSTGNSVEIQLKDTEDTPGNVGTPLTLSGSGGLSVTRGSDGATVTLGFNSALAGQGGTRWQTVPVYAAGDVVLYTTGNIDRLYVAPTTIAAGITPSGAADNPWQLLNLQGGAAATPIFDSLTAEEAVEHEVGQPWYRSDTHNLNWETDLGTFRTIPYRGRLSQDPSVGTNHQLLPAQGSGGAAYLGFNISDPNNYALLIQSNNIALFQQHATTGTVIAIGETDGDPVPLVGSNTLRIVRTQIGIAGSPFEGGVFDPTNNAVVVYFEVASGSTSNPILGWNGDPGHSIFAVDTYAVGDVFFNTAENRYKFRGVSNSNLPLATALPELNDVSLSNAATGHILQAGVDGAGNVTWTNTNALADEATARADADTALSEVDATLASADTALGVRIDNEITARTAGDIFHVANDPNRDFAIDYPTITPTSTSLVFSRLDQSLWVYRLQSNPTASRWVRLGIFKLTDTLDVNPSSITSTTGGVVGSSAYSEVTDYTTFTVSPAFTNQPALGSIIYFGAANGELASEAFTVTASTANTVSVLGNYTSKLGLDAFDTTIWVADQTNRFLNWNPTTRQWVANTPSLSTLTDASVSNSRRDDILVADSAGTYTNNSSPLQRISDLEVEVASLGHSTSGLEHDITLFTEDDDLNTLFADANIYDDNHGAATFDPTRGWTIDPHGDGTATAVAYLQLDSTEEALLYTTFGLVQSSQHLSNYLPADPSDPYTIGVSAYAAAVFSDISPDTQIMIWRIHDVEKITGVGSIPTHFKLRFVCINLSATIDAALTTAQTAVFNGTHSFNTANVRDNFNFREADIDLEEESNVDALEGPIQDILTPVYTATTASGVFGDSQITIDITPATNLPTLDGIYEITFAGGTWPYQGTIRFRGDEVIFAFGVLNMNIAAFVSSDPPYTAGGLVLNGAGDLVISRVTQGRVPVEGVIIVDGDTVAQSGQTFTFNTPDRLKYALLLTNGFLLPEVTASNTATRDAYRDTLGVYGNVNQIFWFDNTNDSWFDVATGGTALISFPA